MKDLIVVICRILTATVLFIGTASTQAALLDSIDKGFDAYCEGDFTLARRIVKKHLDQPWGRFVFYICQIHDTRNQNIAEGLTGLKKLFDDETLDKEIRAEAGMAYARVIQIFQIRKQYLEYDNVQVESLFRNIIKLAPRSKTATFAAVYIAESLFTKYLKNSDGEAAKQAFAFIEDFLASYEGPTENTVLVHLYLETFYIEVFRDYGRSVEHLKKAYELGITNETEKRRILFRLGRIYDARLHDTTTAKAYYEEFLKLYPYAFEAFVIEGYLNELNEHNK
ncbi:MAG: hypothetical protein ABIG61_00500 [Planctomycetota bacterium]